MRYHPNNLLLSPQAMARVDHAAALSGLDSYGLMQRAGFAVAAAALRLFPGAIRFCVLCGPGNNGGDGYVAAAALLGAGAAVEVIHLGDPAKLEGDAARAWREGGQPGSNILDYQPQPGDVVIDALFGAGLSRDLTGDVADLIARVTQACTPVIAVDLPSGIDGKTGGVRGAAFSATHCVTFMCRKPGHVLLPGRMKCGVVEIADIGIPWRVVELEAAPLVRNGLELWQHLPLAVSAADHKYRRGHLTVFSGGPTTSGAARLAAMAGLKSGAGLVTLASPADALAVNAGHLTAIMLSMLQSEADLEAYLADTRRQAFVLGPGFGDLERARHFALRLGRAGRSLVLDADGITAFRDSRSDLADAFTQEGATIVTTPHEGEFSRLFPEIAGRSDLDKVEKTLAAAEALGGVVVYKGADTVIGAPDGRAVIEEHAPPWLATAGSGDVLAGMIGAFLARGLRPFESACAAVHLHGQAALRLGPGLTAEELALAVRPA
ncbi:bifunctional ADP-dependent NAD(P)H-hydrate dehydratase/NAD(P)H-hydrate epimerase [Rhizobium sp. AAP43]|uniref:bifunctional ADP-dependent NAD(P)H-hydrate dehydratase/NAD(P)H-hydrate epimerase n=1 Tax=Rhizobium sp. AAP43 TaxID=1523420 RepID=UPI0006B89169|nr:bifunctional ADP-dependent NAD(P)H-hydrate dehydratase/NAD(P)H-hydrate epimerase [Rhizobium sp. AAP43]KPF43754.1 hypothetical protein IP76_12720 [Rhizobium sp. AAP43]